MTTATKSEFDEARMEAFMGTLMGNLSGTLVTYACAVGDRLGLFRDLATSGPADPDELAARTGISWRYACEWMGCMACAGYLDFDTETRRFSLPAEHVPALATPGHPAYVGAFFEAPFVMEQMGLLGKLADAFKTGKGVPQAAYGPDYQRVIEGLSAGWFDALLVPEWLPTAPGVVDKLTAGAEVADIGSGAGRAIIRMAEAFPASRFTGFDVYEPAVSMATSKASAAGVSDRVRFEQRDAATGLPGRYDLITAIDVLHDMARPMDALRSIRSALKPGGTFLVLEMNATDTPEGNIGPLGAMLYGISILYCLSTSLAQDGAALGTAGLPEARLREHCLAAGFTSVTRLLETPMNVLYEVKA